MLQMMRHLAQTKVIKGLMMILMVSFALWGIGDIFRGNPLQRSVAKAGSISVPVQALNQEFDQALARARQMMGPDLTAQQAKQMGLLDKTLTNILQRAEFDQAIQKLDIDVSPQMVLDQLAAQPQFRDKEGHFNKALFAQILEQAHLNEKTFLEQGRQDLARRQLVDVFSDHGKVPEVSTDMLYKARGQKRIFELLIVKNDSIKDIPAPDEKTLHTYYQENPKPFTAPEYRTVTIARLSADDVLKETVVTDDQVKKEYDAKLDQLAEPERRDILQVVVQDESKAEQIAAQAHITHDLTAAAKAMGFETVLLPQMAEKAMLPELAKPALALHLNDVSAPVKSSLGWHVLQVKKITPAGKPEYKDIQKQLHDHMQQDQAIETVTRMVNQLDDELAAGHALEDIADGMKLRLIKLPLIDMEGKTPDGKTPPEFPNKVDVLKAAFTQGAGEVSPIIDDKNGNYIVIRTDDIKVSALKDFTEVKADVTDAWITDQQAKKAAEKAEKIADGLRHGQTVGSFAGSGIEIRTSKPVSMLGDTDPNLPSSALPEAFKLKKGEVAVSGTADAQIVMQLKDTREADADTAADDEIKITEELKKNMPAELTEEYLKYLQTIFPIEIDQDRLETIRQQGS